MLALVSSYFSAPTPSGAFAVNTSVQRLHRNFSSSYTVAFSAAWPTPAPAHPVVAGGRPYPSGSADSDHPVSTIRAQSELFLLRYKLRHCFGRAPCPSLRWLSPLAPSG